MKQQPDEPLQRVIFRAWPDGEVIAIFPDQPERRYGCGSYMHVGQHGACDPRNVVKETRPAAPTEYAPLLSELQRIGYNLRVMRRLPAWQAMPSLSDNINQENLTP